MNGVFYNMLRDKIENLFKMWLVEMVFIFINLIILRELVFYLLGCLFIDVVRILKELGMKELVCNV